MQSKRLSVIAGAVVAATLAFAAVTGAFAQMQPGMMGGTGQATGPGMMGGTGQTGTALTSLDDAKTAFQAYIDRTGNPDLALDEVMQFDLNFYAIVKQQSTGQGAFELLADPRSGTVFPEFGPNMMWNTTYGHMDQMGGMAGMMGGAHAMMGAGPAGMMGGVHAMMGADRAGMMGSMGDMMSGASGPTAPTFGANVSADQAGRIAQQWLDQNQPGSGTETPDTFPGYFTVHTTMDGQMTGMLSVNAYTGQVWFHTWHGAFRASTEA